MDKQHFSLVSRCLRDWDVMQLFPGAPKDEYDAEAAAVAAQLTDCRNENDVQQCVYEVFKRAFGEMAPERAECRKVAERIWEGIHQE